MAIHFARVKFIKRSEGNSATRVAAYNARAVVYDDRTGERHDFKRMRADLEHNEIMLPAGADPAIAHKAILANMAEAAERRKDSRVGREFVLALPADAEITAADRLALARSFVKEHFVDKGLPAQFDIHRPHEGSKNWHAHVWIPMRRLEGDHFAGKQATDLLPIVRQSHYGVFVAEAELWGQLWTIHQERYFYNRKLGLVVDPVAPLGARTSYGPRRFWGADPANSYAAAAISERRRRNAEAARDPELVFEFAKQQKFDGRTLRRFLEKFIDDPQDRSRIADQVYSLAVDRAYPFSEGGTVMAADTEQSQPHWENGRREELRQAGLNAERIEQTINHEKALASEVRNNVLQSRDLYERYKAEREGAVAARQEAVQEIYDRFSEHQGRLRSFYNMRHEQEQLGPRHRAERQDAHDLLRAEHRGSRVEAQRERTQQLTAARAANPVLSWDAFLTREAGRGDVNATQILERKRAREMEQGQER